MALKAKIEAIIYAAEEPITLEQISLLVKDIVLAEQAANIASAAEALADEQIALGTESVEPVEETEIERSADTPATDETFSEPSSEDSESAETELPESSTPLESEAAPADSAQMQAPEPTRGKRRKSDAPKKELSEDAKVRAHVRKVIEELVAEYENEERGMEIRQIAGGYRMATKAEHHDVVRAFAKSLKPAVRLSLAALETLAVIAYKQPVTVPEISEIRGVESNGVIGTLLDRKLITTSGRKQVIGRPILYKTSKEFLLRFGLNEVAELPSMEEFEKLASDGQAELFSASGSEPSPQPDPEATLETGDPDAQPPTSEVAAEPEQVDGSEPTEVAEQSTAEVSPEQPESPVQEVAEIQSSDSGEPESADTAGSGK